MKVTFGTAYGLIIGGIVGGFIISVSMEYFNVLSAYSFGLAAGFLGAVIGSTDE